MVVPGSFGVVCTSGSTNRPSLELSPNAQWIVMHRWETHALLGSRNGRLSALPPMVSISMVPVVVPSRLNGTRTLRLLGTPVPSMPRKVVALCPRTSRF